VTFDIGSSRTKAEIRKQLAAAKLNTIETELIPRQDDLFRRASWSLKRTRGHSSADALQIASPYLLATRFVFFIFAAAMFCAHPPYQYRSSEFIPSLIDTSHRRIQCGHSPVSPCRNAVKRRRTTPLMSELSKFVGRETMMTRFSAPFLKSRHTQTFDPTWARHFQTICWFPFPLNINS
jgi:hypothetical protein